MTFSVSITTPSGHTITREYPSSKFDDLNYVEGIYSDLHRDALDEEEAENKEEESFHEKVDEGLASWKNE